MLQKNWTKEAKVQSKGVNDELHSEKREIWSEIIRKNGEISPGMKTLDIGTGPGFFAILMEKMGADVTAIDYTQGMLDEAKLNAHNENAEITFQIGDSHKLNFPDNFFDIITSRNVV